MPEKVLVTEAKVADATPDAAVAPTPPTPPRRSPGHRGQDVRDTVAEMAAKAHEISLEAGSKMSGAMKNLIHAAAGITGFAVESARDIVQYMVRRGQMTQDEADRLLRDVEEAQGKRPPAAPKPATESAVAAPAARTTTAPAASQKLPAATTPAATAPKAVSAPKPAPKAEKPAPPAKKKAEKAAPARKAATKAPAKTAAARGAVKSSAAKPGAGKAGARSAASKTGAKSAAGKKARR